jgi:tetratricopeptide (TPR) repeat protein
MGVSWNRLAKNTSHYKKGMIFNMGNKKNTSSENLLSGRKPDESTGMPDRNPEEAIDIDMEKEQTYQKLVDLRNCMGCMTASADKSMMYRRIAGQFKELSGYKEADAFAQLCMESAKQTDKEAKKVIYQEAQRRKSTAKLAEEYKLAAQEFKKASGYQDADDMALECEKRSGILERKAVRKKWIGGGIFILCVAALLLGSQTSHAKYYLANAYQMTGSYPSAIDMYKKLGAYKDSNERLQECRYRYGTEAATEGNYKTAAKEFAAAGNYKDSEEQLIAAQKNLIKNSEPGQKIKVGKYEWLILDILDDRAFLMKNSSMEEMPYHSEPGEITWEKASLRQWLNTQFLEDSFSPAERNNIWLTEVANHDNAVYGTKGGKDTEDYIFMFSAEEAMNYSSLFPNFKTNTWLRSPGNDPYSAAFLSDKGSVMDYGYVATSNQFKVRPVMWYKLK